MQRESFFGLGSAGRHEPIVEMDCPACAERIKAAALKCRFCGHAMGEPLPGHVEPGPPPEPAPQAKRSRVMGVRARLARRREAYERYAKQQDDYLMGALGVLGKVLLTVLFMGLTVAYPILGGLTLAGMFVGIGLRFGLGRKT